MALALPEAVQVVLLPLEVLPLEVELAVFAMLASSDDSVAARLGIMDSFKVIEMLHVPTLAVGEQWF